MNYSDVALYAELVKLCGERFATYDDGKIHGGEFAKGGGRVPKGSKTDGGSKKAAAVDDDEKPAKAKATRGEMISATRQGKGKDATLSVAGGQPVPEHIKPLIGRIPPAWSDVKISTSPDVDLLVTGKDAKGRSQSIYRDDFHMKNAAIKFARNREGLEKHDIMYKQNLAGLKSSNPATREAAAATWLMFEQGTRVGGAGDTGAKVKAYGASTLEGRHVVPQEDGSVWLQFVGKEGVKHDHKIRNPDLAKELVRRSKEAGPNGKIFNTNEGLVSKHVKTLDGGKFTPKDLRTIRANNLAIQTIKDTPPPKNLKEYKSAVKTVAEKVSGVLGNKPAQALESYIDPNVFSVWRSNIEGAK